MEVGGPGVVLCVLVVGGDLYGAVATPLPVAGSACAAAEDVPAACSAGAWPALDLRSWGRCRAGAWSGPGLHPALVFG